VLVAELIWVVVGSRRAPIAFAGQTAVSSVAAIGRSLFTDYAFQFEVTSVLILVALVGAVVLARRDSGEGV
jgi:NADH-quinone oxidoreductase subunit J